MLSYCLKCRKNTESKNPKSCKTKNGRITLLSNCAFYNSKKYRFIKEQEAIGLLSCFEIKTLLSKNPIGVLTSFRGINKLMQDIK